MRFRQIHLDFHTSPDIPGIAADFDPQRFADTLKAAHVDSVTCFARCHHGWVYYDSAAHPDRVHPHLKRRDLLREQIEACHARGIRVPIYITVQWDDLTSDRHRDWLCIDEHGVEFNTPPLAPGFYRFLDVLHPAYRRFLFDHTREVLETLPCDGIFFDIVQPRASLAKHWIDAMDDAGLDPERPADRNAMAHRVINDWKSEMTAFIREHHPSFDDTFGGQPCTVFYNSGHISPRHRATTDAYTHYELESLPSGGWGYLHFPLTARYARTLNKPFIGMTGKFHTAWGDFQSYKSRAALEFECFRMLACGGGCSIGDQLHPAGVLDGPTYGLIGGVYRSVEAKEPWCVGARPVSDVAVLLASEGRAGNQPWQGIKEPDAAGGAVQMLEQLHIQHDCVDDSTGLDGYRLVIAPDDLTGDAAVADRLRAYVEGGGAVIAAGRAGTDVCGVKVTGDAAWSPDFLLPGEALAGGLPVTAPGGELVMYQQGVAAEVVADDAEVLATVHRPYFNRTWRHFCSHRHTPSSGEDAGYPGVVRRGRAIWFAHPIFTQYRGNAPPWVRTLLRNAIRLLLPDPVLTTDGPPTLLVTLNRQPAEGSGGGGRHVLHLLHYLPQRIGKAFDTVETPPPLHGVSLSVAIESDVSSVRVVPDGAPIGFSLASGGGRVAFTVPRVDGHAMIEIV